MVNAQADAQEGCAFAGALPMRRQIRRAAQTAEKQPRSESCSFAATGDRVYHCASRRSAPAIINNKTPPWVITDSPE